MKFNDHSNLEGKHAFMGASKYNWLNYDDDTFEERYINQYAATIGELLHNLACNMIRNQVKLRKCDKNLIRMHLLTNGIPKQFIKADKWLPTLMNYINDAIDLRMTPEVILFYSNNCFGKTDCIYVDDKTIRIHDLKTGSAPVHIEQLLIYCALYCLEYFVSPEDKNVELRIYQNEDIIYHNPTAEEIESIKRIIVERDSYINHVILR